MKKRAMLVANSASMIDHFNRDNILLLQQKGYAITVAANFREGNSSTDEKIAEFRKELEENNIDIIDLPIPRKVTDLKNTKKSISILKNYLEKNPCSIIHTQTPFGGVVGRLAAKKYRKKGKCKVIYFAHGFHFFKGAPLKNKIIYYNIEKYLAKYTDCLITLNMEDYNVACRKFKKTTVKYVPGVGIKTDEVHNTYPIEKNKKKELGLPDDKRIVLNVSELIPRKNVESTFKAFSRLDRDDCILVICGKGVLHDSLIKLSQNEGIADKVYMLGYRTDILEIYKLADVFISTSHQEGLSVATMQAMASGLPVVASDIRGNNDLLLGKSKDYLVKTNNIDGFTRKLEELLGNKKLRNEIGKLNYTNCKKYFDLEKTHNLMSAIYDELEVM